MSPTPNPLVEFCRKLLAGKTIPLEIRPEDHGRGYVVTLEEFIALQRLLQPFQQYEETLAKQSELRRQLHQWAEEKEISTEDLDEGVHALFSQDASSANNDGLESQLDTILAYVGFDLEAAKIEIATILEEN